MHHCPDEAGFSGARRSLEQTERAARKDRSKCGPLPAIERIGIEFAVCRSKVIGCRLLVVTRLEIVDEVRNLARSAKDPVEAAPAPVNRGLRAPVDARHGFATTRLPRPAADRERMVRQVAEIEPDRKSTRLNYSHECASRMPSSA